jgi:Fe2+ or Zn2+ uptake regulation protein
MNYRNSHQRERILQILKETDSHPTADWVYARLKGEITGLSLGTVYRNLKVLMEQGHIQKLPFGSTFDRFDAQLEPHYHLICEECGTVSDLKMPQNSHLNEIAQQISTFKINHHRIDFFGICEKCQKNIQPATKKEE